MLKEFREFISRGNVIDLAVAVIIGTAFTAIVTSLVNDIITPILGIFLGGVNFSSLAITIGEASITYGNFIQAVINFLIVAWVIFMIVRSLNQLQRRFSRAKEEAAAPPPEPSEEVKLLTEIRDLLRAGR
ncbi:MAG: large-conductance mechanosensitive channel protein MscL [Anaerolineae bacterium]|nr:large-conductance mechanosensitive channel protein MscL [Anaerolineales bacterium]MCQ3977925.1 large conductance mechanosensitive channel protein MscL [Anaerolineae bacterium]